MVKSLGIGLIVGTLVGILLRQRGWNIGPGGYAEARVEPPSARPVGDEPKVPSGATERDDLDRLTRPELYRRAAAAGIRGRSEMTKAELIAALRAKGSGGT